MFRHAAKCGARVFDGVEVTEIEFAPFTSESNGNHNSDISGKREGMEGMRPISASWIRKPRASVSETKVEAEVEAGKIIFDYLVDASCRAGLLSTRYLKNRIYNKGLKNVASWGYWEDAGVYARGTPRENVPFFEALRGSLSSAFQTIVLTWLCTWW